MQVIYEFAFKLYETGISDKITNFKWLKFLLFALIRNDLSIGLKHFGFYLPFLAGVS